MRELSRIGVALVVALAASTPSAGAELRTFAGGEEDDRASTWIMYWDAERGRSTGGLALNYNRVEWRSEYAERLDALTRGRTWRLGKHYWTTLDTNLELELADTRVPPGFYYLGIRRPAEGPGWSLSLVDTLAARDARLDAVNIDDAPVALSAPLELSEAGAATDRLEIRLASDAARSADGPWFDGYLGEARLEIALGTLRLTAPLKIRTPDAAPAAREESRDAYWRNYAPEPRRSSVFASGPTLEGRRVSRLFYWNRDAQRSNGEIFVTWGDVRWHEGLREGMESLRQGLTWRLGSGFWTLLDTSLPLEIGGVPVAVGLHYLGVNRSADGTRWSLALLDPGTVRSMRIDAFESGLRAMPVAREIPLSFEDDLAVCDELLLRLDAHESDPRAARFELRLGPYRLAAPIRLLEPPGPGRPPEAAPGG